MLEIKLKNRIMKDCPFFVRIANCILLASLIVGLSLNNLMAFPDNGYLINYPDILEKECSIYSNQPIFDNDLTKNDFLKQRQTNIPSYSSKKNKITYPNYISLSANFIDLNGFGISYGFYPAQYFTELMESISINFSYHFARQEYVSMYMKLPKEAVNIKFHGFGLGIAGDISGRISSGTTFVFTPELGIGIEMPQIKPLLFDEKIDGLRTWYYKPGIKTALVFGRYGFGAGLSYYFYESYVRELNNNILIDNITSDPLSYSKDLFPGREGLQLSLSFIFKF